MKLSIIWPEAQKYWQRFSAPNRMKATNTSINSKMGGPSYINIRTQ